MIDLNQITGGKLADTLWSSRIPTPAKPSPEDRTDRTAASASQERRAVDELVGELSELNAAAELRLRILELLDQSGPRVSTEIPRSWPVTRQYIRAAVGRLMADGLVERVGDGDAPLVGLTATGRRVLEEMARDTSDTATEEPVRAR